MDDWDPYPVGTMTPTGGLQPNDPLLDWGSNMTPSDLMHFMQDRQGFIERQIAAGKPPPAANYTQDSRGMFVPVQTQDSVGFQGEGRGAAPLPYTAEDVGKPAPNPGFVPPGTSAGAGAGDVIRNVGKKVIETYPGPNTGYNPPAVPRPAPAPAPAPASVVDAGAAIAGPVPLPVPRPVIPGEPPAPEPEPAPEAEPDLSKARKTVAALSPEAMSNFARSMQGVKMPEAPKLAPPSGLAVRSPNAMQSDIAQLLTAVGQRAPGAGGISLMKLLGRA